jgi:hypothetical protein
MNTVKIYKLEEDIPTFIIGPTDLIIDSTNYVIWLGECKEEIYLNEELIDTIYHTI